MSGKRLALWGTAALVAVAVSAAGVAMATLSNRDGTVLSQEDIAAQLASERAKEGSASPSGTPPTSADPASPGTPAILRSQAGTLAVRCSGDQVVLDRWSPNPGYRADEVTRAANRVSVWFESDVANDVEAVVTCADGRAVLTENVEVDDHGGGGRNGSGDG